VPEERGATGHGQIAEKATAAVAARRRGWEDDERTIARAEAIVAEARERAAGDGRAAPDGRAAGPDGLAAGADGLLGAAGDALAARLVDLSDAMRARGARVGMGELLAAHRALAAVDASSRAEAFFALRAALCSTRTELGVFASAFAAVFADDGTADPLDDLGDLAKQALPRVALPPAGDEAPAAELTPAPAAWSEEELLREKDFAAYTDAERAAARRLLQRLALKGPKRLSRRTVPTRRRRDEYDLRATVRASLRNGGELFDRRYREQAERPRRLVLICDVSGSMAPYSRMLLQYMQACVAARARVEAFVFGTRLTRVTRELRGRDSDRALHRAALAANDWSGGTRIGAAIAELNRTHGRRIGRGSMVILLSDGWDRGEPDELAEEMARLARTAHRVIWLNPLAADPRYEPLTRGMQAAMPHVDRLLPGNSIASLAALADLMEQGLA
jgi:uncharacterized protein